jgi:lysozyme
MEKIKMIRAMVPDLSHWTGKVDFKKMKAQGIIAVIMKASQQVEDDTFKTYWKDAKDAGLIRGAYHYIDWRISETAQADLFCSLLQSDPGELPPILDLEMNPAILSTLQASPEKDKDPHPYNLVRSLKGGPIPKQLKKEELFGSSTPFTNTRSKVFLNIVENRLKKTPMVYSGYYYMNDYVLPDSSWLKYMYWLPWYNVESIIRTPSPWTKWDFWQYTDVADGPSYGVASAELDMSYYNGTKEDLQSRFTIPVHPSICPTCGQAWPVVIVPNPPPVSNSIVYTVNPGVLLNVRNAPNGTIIGTIKAGTDIIVGSEIAQNGYIPIVSQVGFPSGGWIYKTYVTRKV